MEKRKDREIGRRDDAESEKREIPKYGERDSGWRPDGEEDFADGGAYPEVDQLQYPLQMGRSGSTALTTSSLSEIPGMSRQEIIARVGHGEERLIQTSLHDARPKSFSAEQLMRPDAEQIAAETEAARKALQSRVAATTARTQPKSVAVATAHRHDATQMLRYRGRGEDAPERVIKLVEMPVDPLQPPKFKHKRIPRPPPSPPAPRLHSPPRSISAEEQKAWRIPPCISSWKNPRGYTVPLDKRLAADGRALQERSINSRMSDLAEALFLAEKHNREEVQMRAAVEQKVAEQERRQRDEQLRQLAEKAREDAHRINAELARVSQMEEAYGRSITGASTTVAEREQIRSQVAYEQERLFRSSKQRPAPLKDRDISEQIALGQFNPSSTKESLFDPLLFEQDQSKVNNDIEDAHLYDKPLFSGSSAIHMIYKSNLGAGARPDKAFAGSENIVEREGPVQFEKLATTPVKPPAKEEIPSADPFGLDQFLHEAKKGKRPTHADADADAVANQPSSKRSRE